MGREGKKKNRFLAHENQAVCFHQGHCESMKWNLNVQKKNQISLAVTMKPPFYPLFLFPPNTYPWFWFLLWWWLLLFLFEGIWKDFRWAYTGFSWYVFCHCQPSSVASWANAELLSNGAHWPTVEILQNIHWAFNLLALPACSVAIIAFGLLEKHIYIQMIST